MESLPHPTINFSEVISAYHSMPFLRMLEESTVLPESLLQQHLAEAQGSCVTQATESSAAAVARERKRRKRQRPAPPAEEAESQRLTHIAVERNRRRLMNQHLATLRDLMPASFVPRGDQASIVGGAIEFVKELEQHLVTLQAEKRLRAAATTSSSASPEDDAANCTELCAPPQGMSYSRSQQLQHEGVDVEATVVQGHVSLKVAAPRVAGQLVRALAAVEELRLSVLHLNVTAMDERSSLYSLNLKMEEDCQLTTADEIATAVHQIFTYINACYC